MSRYVANPKNSALGRAILQKGAGPLSLIAALPLAYFVGKLVASASKPVTGRMQYYQSYAVPPNPLLPQYSAQIYRTMQKEGSMPILELTAPFAVLTYSNYRILKNAQQGMPPNKIEMTISGHPIETLFGTALLTHLGRKGIGSLLRGAKI